MDSHASSGRAHRLPTKNRNRAMVTVIAVPLVSVFMLVAMMGYYWHGSSAPSRWATRAIRPSSQDNLTLISVARRQAAWQGNAAVIVVGNRAMNDMTENWAVAADSVRPALKYIILPLDEEGYTDLRRRGITNVVRDDTAWAQFSSNGSSFGGLGYKTMSLYKWRAAYTLLKEGIDVLMTDPDVVMLRNPLPYIVSY